jgi:phosphoribosylamine--glycine ligase
MHVLILGSGGREHALCWKIKQSPLCEDLFVAPGNAGTDKIATNIALDISDFELIGEFCLDYEIEMVIVGPEGPLVEGIYDFFREDSDLEHIAVVGPSEEGAQLEGSKSYAKKFMKRHGIPTAGYEEFTLETLDQGSKHIEQANTPIVLKCDGLAAGKGVVILEDREEAKEELSGMVHGKFGGAGSVVVIEEFLDGIEFSVFVLTDGKDYKILPVAKDYKRIGEGNTGLNTGGMGAISPPPFVDDALMHKVRERIIEPTIKGLNEEEIDYKGFIFLGLIKVGENPYVIEYNCRLGDPETEAVLPRLDSDLLELFASMYNIESALVKHFAEQTLEISSDSAATVMLVSGGYPEVYEKGFLMTHVDDEEASLYFHAGTTIVDNDILTNGGRVIAITSLHEDFRVALKESMKHAARIKFKGKHYRTDIGFDL